jgi:hypothetical protein
MKMMAGGLDYMCSSSCRTCRLRWTGGSGSSTRPSRVKRRVRDPLIARNCRHRNGAVRHAPLLVFEAGVICSSTGPDLDAVGDLRRIGHSGSRSQLASTFAATDNIHKWLQYLPAYESALSRFRSWLVWILDIGELGAGFSDASP